MNKIRTVNNSRRPKSIKNDAQNFPNDGKLLKLPLGPKSPIAGPTFPRQAAATPIAFLKSSPKNPKTKLPKMKESTYKMKKVKIFPKIS